MAGGSVRDQDQGLDALIGRVKDSKGLVLTVGIHGPEGAEEHKAPEGSDKPAGGQDGEAKPPTVADIATVHEYGLGNNPERSWLRGWADEQKAQNEANMKKIGQAVVEGKFTAQTGLERAGNLFVGQIQARIVAGIAPPLTEQTIKRKGSSTPLVNTGQMKSAIRFKVGKDQT